MKLAAIRCFTTLLYAATLTVAVTQPASADNWPAWRGAEGRGISAERGLPEKWTAGENVAWKTPLPDIGNSTPIIWEDHIFITQALEKGTRRAILAFDRKTGKQLWQREVACDVEETSHRQNPPCSSSPVTDGKAVYAHFSSSGVIACDFDGKLLWHRKFGAVLHRWGNGGSPIIYKNMLIVFQGPGEPTFLTALDRTNGKTVWRSDEVGINSPIFGSWSTPVVVRSNDRDELILPLPGERIGGIGLFKAYNPNNGNMLWRCDGMGNEVYAMPIVGDGGKFVVGVSGHNAATLAVETGGSGDVTATRRLWTTKMKTPQRIGSGIIHNGLLYISNANGILECLQARTGERVWRERLGGNLWGSILLADGKLHVSNIEGDTFLVGTGSKFKLLAKNSIGETLYAAPAVSQGQIFLRTWKNLYCIGNAEK
jgi:outer membrane protein assembly factor BamB